MFKMQKGRPFHISYWKMQALGWSCFYLWWIGTTPSLIGNMWELKARTLDIAFYFAGSCLLRPICRRIMDRSTSILFSEAWAAVYSMIFGTVVAWLTELILTRSFPRRWSEIGPASVGADFTLFVWCSLYFSFRHWQAAVLERERLLKAESESRQARLHALRCQLNPHFLFNSLNAVSTLVVEGREDAATQMLAEIGDLLRTSFDSEEQTEIPLRQEITFTERYLRIEQIRLGNRLRVDFRISDETLDLLVPNMLLQPLAENAVRHGISYLIQGGQIAFRCEVHGARLLITVSNSGPPRTSKNETPSRGIGLRNTAERLATLYGENHSFSIDWPPSGGCIATIDLPVRISGLRTRAHQSSLGETREQRDGTASVATLVRPERIDFELKR